MFLSNYEKTFFGIKFFSPHFFFNYFEQPQNTLESFLVRFFFCVKKLANVLLDQTRPSLPAKSIKTPDVFNNGATPLKICPITNFELAIQR